MERGQNIHTNGSLEGVHSNLRDDFEAFKTLVQEVAEI